MQNWVFLLICLVGVITVSSWQNKMFLERFQGIDTPMAHPISGIQVNTGTPATHVDSAPSSTPNIPINNEPVMPNVQSHDQGSQVDLAQANKRGNRWNRDNNRWDRNNDNEWRRNNNNDNKSADRWAKHDRQLVEKDRLPAYNNNNNSWSNNWWPRKWWPWYYGYDDVLVPDISCNTYAANKCVGRYPYQPCFNRFYNNCNNGFIVSEAKCRQYANSKCNNVYPYQPCYNRNYSNCLNGYIVP